MQLRFARATVLKRARTGMSPAPDLKPPAGGCKAWADLPQYDKYWVGGKPPTGVGSACVQQGLGNPEANFGMADMGTAAQAHTIAS